MPARGGGPYIVHEDSPDADTAPCSGYVDPRIESTNGVNVNLGLDRVRIRFSEQVFHLDGGPVRPVSFAITHTNPDPAPTVIAVTTLNAEQSFYEVRWTPVIAVQHWTTIRARVRNVRGDLIENQGDLGPGMNEPDRVDLAAHPGNFDQNSMVSPLDYLRFRRALSPNCACPSCGGDEFYEDIDRNGAYITPLDLLRMRQIILGAAPATRPWSQVPFNVLPVRP